MTDIEREIAELDELIARCPDDAEAVCRRGNLHWKLGHRAEAMTDFNRSAAIDPNGPGAAAARLTNEILDFFNPDLYNP